jgi:hypothetical protein
MQASAARHAPGHFQKDSGFGLAGQTFVAAHHRVRAGWQLQVAKRKGNVVSVARGAHADLQPARRKGWAKALKPATSANTGRKQLAVDLLLFADQAQASSSPVALEQLAHAFGTGAPGGAAHQVGHVNVDAVAARESDPALAW